MKTIRGKYGTSMSIRKVTKVTNPEQYCQGIELSQQPFGGRTYLTPTGAKRLAKALLKAAEA